MAKSISAARAATEQKTDDVFERLRGTVRQVVAAFRGAPITPAAVYDLEKKCARP